MDFTSRNFSEKKNQFNKCYVNDPQKKVIMKNISVFKNTASSVLDQSLQRRQSPRKANQENLWKNEFIESKYNNKFISPIKSNNNLLKVIYPSSTPQPNKRDFNSNSSGRKALNVNVPCFISSNLYEYEKNNFFSVSPSNINNFITFLSIWNEMDVLSKDKLIINNKNNLFGISKRFILEMDSYFIQFHNTINIFEEKSLNLILQKTYKFCLIIVTVIIIVNADNNESLNIKNIFRKMISTLTDAMCLIYELFIFHDKNLFGKDISKELCDKVQKTANLHFNTLLNKSFKKNKIKEILLILNKIFENLTIQIKSFFSSESFNPVFIKICLSLIDKIEEVKFTNFATLIIHNVLYCFLKDKRVLFLLNQEIKSNNINNDLNNINYEPPYLPDIRSEFKYTVVLDLDETLIHYIDTPSKDSFILRPKAIEFLNEISKFCEIVIFTSGTKEYADSILDQIDPLYSLIKYRLYRHHTRKNCDLIFKDLSDLGRDLSKVVMIDNLEENYINQYDNGLLSLTWVDDIFDTQLNDFLTIFKFMYENQIKNIPDFIQKINEEIDKYKQPNKIENLYKRINLKSMLF